MKGSGNGIGISPWHDDTTSVGEISVDLQGCCHPDELSPGLLRSSYCSSICIKAASAPTAVGLSARAHLPLQRRYSPGSYVKQIRGRPTQAPDLLTGGQRGTSFGCASAFGRDEHRNRSHSKDIGHFVYTFLLPAGCPISWVPAVMGILRAPRHRRTSTSTDLEQESRFDEARLSGVPPGSLWPASGHPFKESVHDRPTRDPASDYLELVFLQHHHRARHALTGTEIGAQQLVHEVARLGRTGSDELSDR